MAKGIYYGVGNVAHKVKKLYRGVENFAKRNLPSGYTQVEDIEATGTQYIDTGFKPNQDTRVVMDAQMTSISGAAFYFGARATGYINSFAVLYSGSASALRSTYGSENLTFSSTDYTARVMIDKNKTLCRRGNETLTHTASNFQNAYNMYLFASNEFGTVGSLAKMRLYSCQIYDNDTLVRDFVPCTNSNGTVGLYDMVGGSFYTNAGTGAFVVGDTYKSVARKTKKAYIGIGGVARPFFSGGELAYYGTATALSAARRELAATTVGNYALFGGGITISSINRTHATVDAYNTSLTRTTPTDLGNGTYQLAATSVGDYALFGGGRSPNKYLAYVAAYNKSLTRTNPTAIRLGRSELAATTVGNYALFCCGRAGSSAYSKYVDAYDTSLTQTQYQVSNAVCALAATTVGNYALLGGGTGATVLKYVYAYDTSLTRTSPTALSVGRYNLAATTVGNYALFGGGITAASEERDIVDAYDTSLTHSTPTVLSLDRASLAATTVGNYALFGGGQQRISSTPYGTVDAYDTSLTRTTPTELNTKRFTLAATTIGNYALFGGGANDNTSGTNSAVVDVYTVV